MALALEEGLARRITAIGITVRCNCTVDTGLSNGSWPIYVGFLSMLAHIRRVFRRVFAGHVGPITLGFCRVFVGLFEHVGPIYVNIWSWFALGS